VRTIHQPMLVAGRETTVSASVGVVVSRNGEESIEELLRDADLAMYQAKDNGRGRWELFDPQAGSGVREHYELEAALRVGISRGELLLHYQPEVRLGDGQVVGFEALARWQHPERGLLMPGSFIPLAEGSDLITELDREVLRQACVQVRDWLATGRDVTVGVNVSVRSLRPGHIDELLAIVGSSGVDASAIKLEVTERLAMLHDESTGDGLRRLRDSGLQLVVDDFGTGYSSLARLQELPVDALKVDRAFIASVDCEAAPRAIVGAVAALAHELGLAVVAEGVETVQQWDAVGSLGCDTAQGHFISVPLAASEARQWFADHAGGFSPARDVDAVIGAQRDASPDELTGLGVGEE